MACWQLLLLLYSFEFARLVKISMIILTAGYYSSQEEAFYNKAEHQKHEWRAVLRNELGTSEPQKDHSTSKILFKI